MAAAAGAHALGLVSAMPSGPGVIDEELIAEIVRTAPPGVETFLLTAHQEADAVIDQHRRCRPSTLQLVDHFPSHELARLRRALPGVKLVQVIHVTGPESVDEACAAAPLVDMILLDSGNQKLAVKELGGTGRTHDWDLSRQIRQACGKPMFLAGGLKPENVAQALRHVQPFGLDLCSGVRTDGRLDPVKLNTFFAAVGK